jgi:galactokinase
MTHRELLAASLDRDRVRATVERVIGGEAVDPLEDLLVCCAQRLHEEGIAGTQPMTAFFVPGRIEVLGKHTDYAGGRSLLAALDRGICLVAVPREESTITVADALSGEGLTFPLSAGLQPETGWPNYPMTVARRLARNFPGPWRGASIAFASNLPPAAGMSSSSALVVASFLALEAVNELSAREPYRANLGSREALADYLAAVESGADFRGLAGDAGVGTKGGSQDHTALICARSGRLVQYSFAPVRFERAVPLPAGYRLAMGVSGVRAEKTGAALQRYNRAAEQMSTIVHVWRRATGRGDATLGAALAADPRAEKRLPEMLRAASLPAPTIEALLARLQQFLEESTVVIPAASDALARGDLAEFGRLVDRSQRLAETALQNQVAETIELVRCARELGAVAASAFGAGFGGSVWALVADAGCREFLDGWHSAYIARFPRHTDTAQFFTTRPGPPAVRLA